METQNPAIKPGIPKRGGGTIHPDGLKELSEDIKGSASAATTENVNGLGLPSTFIKDASRHLGVETRFNEQESWSLQTCLPEDKGLPGETQARQTAVDRAMREFCDSYLDGDLALLSVLGRTMQQASFSRLPLIASAIIGLGDFRKDLHERPFLGLKDSNMKFTLTDKSIQENAACFNFQVKLTPEISGIVNMQGDTDIFVDSGRNLSIEFDVALTVNRNAARDVFTKLQETAINTAGIGRGDFPPDTVKVIVSNGTYSYNLEPAPSPLERPGPSDQSKG